MWPRRLILSVVKVSVCFAVHSLMAERKAGVLGVWVKVLGRVFVVSVLAKESASSLPRIPA